MESMSEEVNGALDTLSERERIVLEMYFGINRDSAMTLNEIGEEFDLTRESASNKRKSYSASTSQIQE